MSKASTPLLRGFDVLLDGEIPFAARLGEHAEHHA
jgi:hypothetical protein